MKRLLHLLRRALRGRDKGTVALTFSLALPILLLLYGIIVQYALLANAKLTIDRAVQSGARSALTALPIDPAIGDRGGPDFVRRSILMTLEALSPVSPDGPTSDAQTVADALQQVGQVLPDRYTSRYTFAQNATVITIQPIDANGSPITVADFSKLAAPRVRLTVTYDYQITVPVINMIGRVDTIAGVTGRFRTFTSTLDVQLSAGREAPTNAEGVP